MEESKQIPNILKKIFMSHGEKLHKYFKYNKIPQKQILEQSTFSKSKMYNLFKQKVIDKLDQEILINEFNLEKDFFDTPDTLHDSDNYYKMYHDLLKEYNESLIQLAECRQKHVELLTQLQEFSFNEKGIDYLPKLKKK